MTLVQSLVHKPLVLTATPVIASTSPTSNPTSEFENARDPPSRPRSAPSHYTPSEETRMNAGPSGSRGIFSQPLPQQIPRLFITRSQRDRDHNRYAIYVLTKSSLCSCSLGRLLSTVSIDPHSPSSSNLTLPDLNRFTIGLVPGYDFSGATEHRAFRAGHSLKTELHQTYTLADVLTHHLSLLATGPHKLAPGRFLVLVHEDWLVNGLLLVEFDVPSTQPPRSPEPEASASTSSGTNINTSSGTSVSTGSSSNPSSKTEREGTPTPRPDIPSLDHLSNQTRGTDAAAAPGRLGFLRIGADWAWNALRLLQEDLSHWSELKEVELTAEWADEIDGYTGTEWQTMGLDGHAGTGLMPTSDG